MNLCPQREHTRHRQAASMADAESPDGHPQRRGGLRSAAGELNFRRRAGRALDHHVGEGYSRAEARAERLEHGLFGGKPPRQSFDPIVPVADLIELGLNEATREKRVARIFDPALHLANVY